MVIPLMFIFIARIPEVRQKLKCLDKEKAWGEKKKNERSKEA